ncbi:hypothetical protein F5Y01DRAFT_328989 [Xylaria sp. FL0043]|nr:hypothetical protein F5Y01DRAFT_328989 [Xylaria sp. FL0043]
MQGEQGSSSGAEPREKDWAEVKAEIAKLVEAIGTLAPSKAVDPPPKEKREWKHDELAMQMFYPANVREAFDHLLDIFLSIFSVNGIRQAFEAGRAWFASNFIDQLTLRIALKIEAQNKPGEGHHFSPSNPCLNSDQLKNHINATSQWAVPLLRSDEELTWTWPLTERYRLHLPDINDSNNALRWMDTETHHYPHLEKSTEKVERVKHFGSGAIVHLRVPIEDSIISLGCIKMILAQAGLFRYNISNYLGPNYYYHLGMITYYLGTFAGEWSSRNERSRFLHSFLFVEDSRLFSTVQLHFRSFTVAEALQVSQNAAGNQAKEGLLCKRKLARVPSLAPGVAALWFREKRISVFGVLSTQHRDFNADAYILPTYRVTILSEDATRFPSFSIGENLRWRTGLEGIIVFQTAILAVTEIWEKEWVDIFDEIDDRVQFQLQQTMNPIQISKWMFDADFKRSRVYFILLQVLRIFGEYIRTVSDDLDGLSSLFLKPGLRMVFKDPTPDELTDIKSNWEFVIRFQKDAEQRLLSRLSYKTEEIKSLRDGLFSATSLQETNRSATMNRYVIIFTVVTVLFLPPTFTSTVFALDFFKKDDARQTTWEFKVTTVVISLATYITAGLCVLAVNWKHIKARLYSWWPATHEKTGTSDTKGKNVDNAEVNDAVPVAQPDPGSSNAEPQGGQLAAEARDLESAGQQGGDTAKRPFRIANVFIGLRSRRSNAGTP